MHAKHIELMQRFSEFDAQYPKVWDLFVAFTFEVIRAGHSHYSADAVLHRVRWETTFDVGAPPHEFKINNNYSAFYARKFREAFPQYAQFFRTRVSVADGSSVDQQGSPGMLGLDLSRPARGVPSMPGGAFHESPHEPATLIGNS